MATGGKKTPLKKQNKMRTVTKTVYSFNELSQEAQTKAIEHHRQNFDFTWQRENFQSFEKFADLFDFEIKDYSIGAFDTCDVSIKLNHSDDAQELTGVRLLKYIWNNYSKYIYEGKYYSVKTKTPVKHKRVKTQYFENGNILNSYRSAITLESSCPFTGYYMDDNILKPIFDFMAKPCKHTSLRDLLETCAEEWAKSWKNDMEWQLSDEYIKEELEDNEYEFNEDGTIA